MAKIVKTNTTVGGYRLLFGYLGTFIKMVGVILLLPLLCIPFYTNELYTAVYFILPSILTFGIGFILTTTLLRGKTRLKLSRHQDAILVVLIWILAIVFSCFPFLISQDYTLAEALYESASGFTTTGLTVVDVTHAPNTLLFFRSILQLFGGIGLVLVFTTAISNRFGMKLYSAEGHTDRLMPNLGKSARLILGIYFGYIVIGTIAYMLFNMSVFDALNHAIAAISTGGFSTKAGSIGEFDSLGIEIITMVLMLLGSISFLLHLYILKGKAKKVINHAELRFFLFALIIFIPLLTHSIMAFSNMGLSFGESLRHGSFYFVSSITTTGFSTKIPATDLPSPFLFYIMVLMFIGGGLGSTSGGIKQMRFALWIKGLYWNVRNRLSHKRTIRTNYIMRFGRKDIVDQEELNENSAFVGTFFFVFIIGSMIFTILGATLDEAVFDFASSLSCTGFSTGFIANPTNPLILITSIFGMIFGRLDLIIVFLAIGRLLSDITQKRIL